MRSPDSSICAMSASFSSADPSHQWMRPGWVRRATSSTHASNALFVVAIPTFLWRVSETVHYTRPVNQMADLLGAGGPLAQSLDGFNPRRDQQKMAAAVADALENRRALVVEAGTGTGKTFAYLVPALQSGLKVLVSTGTKNLQDQL